MTDAPATAQIEGAAKTAPVTVTLDQPIPRGDQAIGFVQLRKPRSGELRGLSLVSIGQLEVTALRVLLPRISNPVLTEADIDGMDPADLLALGAEVSGFLLRKAERPDSLAS